MGDLILAILSAGLGGVIVYIYLVQFKKYRRP
jgi:hypothetical protein